MHELPRSVIASITRVPLKAIPAVLAAVNTDTRKRATSDTVLMQLARLILDLPLGGASKLRALERALINAALERTHGNVSAAARLLGADRKVIERKIARIERQA